VINVVALYADKAGCGDYRVQFPAAAVNARSEELGVHVTTADHLAADATVQDGRYTVRRVDLPAGTDVVVFQRPLSSSMAGAMMWLRKVRHEVGIVVDLDDDLAAVPTSNSAFHGVHPKSSPEANYQWLRKSIAMSDVLTVSTPELAMRYRSGSGTTRVVRNGVPTLMLDQPSRPLAENRARHDGADRVIGWAGYVGTHGGDLESTCGALGEIVGVDHTEGRRVSFRNVGPPDGLSEALGLRLCDIEATGWVDPKLYRVALGEADVGIVPLATTRFNRSKSALKALEFAAAGVPVVASYTPEHIEMRAQGMPLFLVKDKRRHWTRALRSILDFDDDELRNLAFAHREFVRNKCTVELRATEWASAWRTAASLARNN